MNEHYVNSLAVAISEIENDGEDTLYEVTPVGSLSNYSMNTQPDYLSADEAFELAEGIECETGAAIIWECTKPSGYEGWDLAAWLERGKQMQEDSKPEYKTMHLPYKEVGTAYSAERYIGLSEGICIHQSAAFSARYKLETGSRVTH